MRVTCSEACRVAGTLYRGKKKVGKGSKKLTKAGTAKLKLLPSKKGRKALASKTPKRVIVRLRAADTAGNRGKLVTRKIAIRK